MCVSLCVCSVAQSCLTLCDPWTVTCKPPLSMGLSRQEYWNGLPFPSTGGLPDPGIKPRSAALQADIYHLSCHGSPIYMCTHTHTHTMYMYICTYMHIHVCICVYTHVYVTCVHMYIYICVYMYVCTYMYMYNVYIHTHTHIYNWITLLYARN